MGTTRQRQVIHKILSDRVVHMTADQILERARFVYPSISKGTVYRNLNLMADEGAIRRVHVPGQPVLYDANIMPHQHKVCVECGSIIDIGNVKTEEIGKLIGPDDKIVDYNLIIYAVCKECIDKELK